LTGTIKVFPNESAVASADTFLDLSDKISLGGERGLFSLAFHPNFPTNRFVYVHYSEKGTGATVIARYTVRQDNPNQVDAATEKIIFYLGQPDSVHNGGSILFGTDGYLYITLGDGGTQGDLHGNGQNRTTYYGSILRIDVDNEQDSKSYAIPTDNPFVGNSEGFLEEIYAWGFRNPWRASFDRATHELYVGDVGQSSVEEVDIVLPGRNYGWNVMEASSCFAASSCEQTGLELPIYEYPHATGLSITGGYVYRGTDLDFLTGQYVFGDFTLGKLFILKKTPDGYEAFERFDTDFFISTFGEDEAGELYFGDYGSGKVYRLLARDS
ncbi:MAG: PQQ-dependent sugar dehydrogenase, partial [Bdellovibrionales bacterium]|nr:PQQ-dependent sugar dehydrogenase [Bdellovibrionales bacterium]